MKIPPARAEKFIQAPDAGVVAVLIYGPDNGLVRERSNRLAQSKLGDLKDNFGLTDLSENDLKSDPARLADEAAAFSMLADARVVRVRGAGDITGRIADGFLKGVEDGSVKAEALVIFESGELTPRSKLRALAEKSKIAASVACYADEGRALQSVVEETLRAAQLSIDSGAMGLLLTNLGQDRGLTRQELEKLMLFKGVGTASFAGGQITSDDIEAILGVSEAGRLDEVMDAAMFGNMEVLDHALNNVFSAGMNAPTLLRMLGTHIERIYSVRTQKDQGADTKQAMKSLRPPVFFKREKAFARQVAGWPPNRLERAMTITLKAEIECKRTGSADHAICAQAFMSIAAQGRRLVR